MARARNIKPGIFKNEVLGVADPLLTLLFEGLWLLADREGRLEDRPLRIKGEIFPYRDGLDVNSLLDWLQANGFIRRYVSDGVKCIVVLEFVKHQNPHKNEPESALPAPGSIDAATEPIGAAPEKIGSAPADSLSTDSGFTDSGFLTAESAAGAAASPASSKRDYTQEFESAWESYPRRPNDSKADAFKAWKARLKDGVKAEVMAAGAARYAAYCAAEGTEGQFIKQGGTFFGPGRHFEAAWTPGVRASPRAGSHSGFDTKNYHAGANADGSF